MIVSSRVVILVMLVLASQAIGQQDTAATLAAPELLKPADGGHLSPFEGEVDWSNVSEASGYQIQFGTECGEGLTYFSQVSSYTLVDLDDDTYYFWRVRTRNKKGQWGEFSECRMFSTHPDRPGLPRHLKWQTEGGETSRLSWVAPLGGTPVHHYLVQVIELGAAGNDTIAINNVVETHQDVPVKFGMTYRARVAGVDSLERQGGFSKWTPVYGPEASFE